MEEAQSVIDLTDVLQSVASLLLVVLVSLAVVAINWVRQKAGLSKLEKDSIVRQYLEAAIGNAIKYAISKVPNKVTVTGNAAVVGTAATYLLQTVPDALTHFGITEERLRQMIEARLSAPLVENEPAGNLTNSAG